MRIQVVHCHPLTDSYDHALFRAIVETLESLELAFPTVDAGKQRELNKVRVALERER